MAILTRKCPHCLADHIALHVVAVTEINEYRRAVFLRCPRCKLPSAAVVIDRTRVAPSHMAKEAGDVALEADGRTIESFWPETAEADSPEHVPPEVRRVYLQAERNFPAHGNEEAAGTMYRKALDLAFKRVDPSLTGMLGQKIKQLTGRLTPEIIEWSGHIRDLGNEAAHDDEPPSRTELTDLRNFTDSVLRYLFTLPGMVKKRRGEKLPWDEKP